MPGKTQLVVSPAIRAPVKTKPPTLVSQWLPARHWLMKTEPDVFSFSDLLKKGTEKWDGVRNYQARNFMRDGMKVGHKVIIYHSNAEPSGVAGLAEVVKLAEPDQSALDSKSEYFDPKVTKDQNPWCCVTVGFPKKHAEFVSLEVLKADSRLREMLLVRKGQRLSILPLKPAEYKRILELMNCPKEP
jgi:predicted RNA-binding protein with PUA-like domain